MTPDTKKLSAALLIALLLCGSVPLIAEGSSAETNSIHGDFLIDEGNGKTKWVQAITGTTIRDVVVSSVTGAGHTCIISGTTVNIDGTDSYIIGSTGTTGSLSTPGSTSRYVTSSWQVFVWSTGAGEWEPADLDEAYSDQYLAVGFYPAGMVPVETPEYRSSWTQYAVDSENSGNQYADIPAGDSKNVWTLDPSRPESADAQYGAILYARGLSIVKFGYADGENKAYIACYETATGTQKWLFKYEVSMYETTTPVIAGNHIFIQSSKGMVYTFDWAVGPGSGDTNVRTFSGIDGTSIPAVTAEVKGYAYGVGPTSMVYDSGCLFLKSSNGMVYCLNNDLEVIWSYQTGGNTYFTSPTVYGDYVAAGMYDGNLYILNKKSGNLVASALVYESDTHEPGAANVPMFLKNNSGLSILVSYSDGKGMSSKINGIAVFDFDGASLTKIKDYSGTFGSVSNYFTKYGNSILFSGKEGLHRMESNGDYKLLSSDMSGSNSTHAFFTLVNEKKLFASTYSTRECKLYMLDLDGKIEGYVQQPVQNFSMSPVVVVDGYYLGGNDTGAFCFTGSFLEYVGPGNAGNSAKILEIVITSVAAVAASVAALWVALRFGLKWEKPFSVLKDKVYLFFFGENYSHNRRSKHKLWAVLVVGVIITLSVALASLCIGSETTLDPVTALKTTFSAIMKGGHGLTYEEMLIFNARLPRTMAALAVGIGLSIAGAVYQAVIKNPLVEPYIMGVSSGAGTLAVAVMALNFTFFGLLSPHNIYLTAVCSIIGGLTAFGLTMLLAEKTGGKSTNYVLAGIVIGLVFGAAQSLMMTMAGKNVTSALSWLYGSFTMVTWEKVWLIVVPVLTLSFVPLIWAKELNLILLGEDQAKQMGLDAERFDRFMLIIASILTAFCVAFCGVIGFVGLVIPHLSRMILGGDHRLMLPTAMAFGGFLMIAADLLSRVLITGYELPVGAITTVIGVPVFAYLLVRRGRSYE